MQSAEVADLRCLPQEGEPDDVLQGLSAGHVRVPDRALLLRGFHGVRARVQAARHSIAALAKGHEVSDRLGSADETGEFRSPFTLIAHFARRQVRPLERLSIREEAKTPACILSREKETAHAHSSFFLSSRGHPRIITKRRHD